MTGNLKASKPLPCCGTPPCSHPVCEACRMPVCPGTEGAILKDWSGEVLCGKCVGKGGPE